MTYLAELEDGDMLKIESKQVMPTKKIKILFIAEMILQHIKSAITKIYEVGV